MPTMASFSLHSPPSHLHYHHAASFPRHFTVAFKTSYFGPKLHQKPLRISLRNRAMAAPTEPAVTTSTHTFDVVIIGAGIIGLTVARQFLVGSDLSVAVVDKAAPCSGATGAGQGYLWMVHRTPGSDTWGLTLRSHQLWKMFAESVREQGLDPLEVLGWKNTGSLLVGRTREQSMKLEKQVNRLREAGLRAECLSSHDLPLKEPALDVGEDGGAAFLPDDCQLDAHRTVAFILKGNREFGSKGRYAEFFHDPVTGLLRSNGHGKVEAVQTSKNTLYCKKGVIVAAGCWSGSLMHDLLRGSDIVLDLPVKPRKGHLLVLENFSPFSLNHGLMEAGYVDHLPKTVDLKNYASGMADQDQNLSVSMTATMDAVGNLLLGSSRQFAGFGTDMDESTVNHIWMRAGEFFPKLKALSLGDLPKDRHVRVGLRPYMPDGKPVIGPVPALMNVFIAAGHEGGGLSMALGTAEMVADMVLGRPELIDSTAFAVQGRFSC
ncbi:hypothetical protein Tsubulata_036361 [Turnera subulata]|uniref:FAD-dependent oxidoreductase domain-containing protein 1 n=1 Tax=Turnera subulata TaxID=218843 RepID=A0A9Q0FHI0_9ROSI|nr:hypothetical protein Tsubulata_036361 [Turnera subulata]